MFFEVTTVLCAVAAVTVASGPGRGSGPARPPRLPRRRPPTWWVPVTIAAGAVTVATMLFGPLAGPLVFAGAAAVWWRRRGRSSPERLPVDTDLPILIGLIASGIRAGATLPACLTAVSRAATGTSGAELAAVAERLRLGAEPAEAWRRSALPAPLLAVGRDLARASETGAPVADLLDRHAADLRRASRARSMERIERLGVLVIAPLGTCFLPAFILIGLVPMAAGLLDAALAH
ncbi:type II secretion system F family protein [Nocardiopsis alba]|uniref:type II secretion system F family protein n=1 Tax=Nocardiopsis alba TaxID=53437 RepID=UPI0033AFA988